ncbi:MAG: MYG1 family protein [bacterium]|nr:MYG1 family protein [bacterium]
MKIITHSGSFQADDIFAVAILILVIGESEVVRTRDKDQIATADYVVDVGMIYDPRKNRFDHHQPGGAGERPNGIPYASCGLVWKEYGERLAGGREEADLIDTSLMQPLDAHDNGVAIADYRFKGVRTYSIVDFFYSFRTSLHESEEELYKIFMELVKVAKGLLAREIDKAKGVIGGEVKVREAFEMSTDKRIIILSEDLPWGRVLSEKLEVIYVIYPRNDGRWGVRAVPDIGYTSRRPLPVTWAGKTDKDLQEITGVSDAIFCHRALFMAVAKTKDGAIKLAEIALNA